jgi:hypothetical protein
MRYYIGFNYYTIFSHPEPWRRRLTGPGTRRAPAHRRGHRGGAHDRRPRVQAAPAGCGLRGHRGRAQEGRAYFVADVQLTILMALGRMISIRSFRIRGRLQSEIRPPWCARFLDLPFPDAAADRTKR